MKLLWLGGGILVCLIGGFIIWQLRPAAVLSPAPLYSHNSFCLPSSTPEIKPEATPFFAFPIADFEARITKKDFGTHITPATSPVQPEKFSGYHTGVDVEYQDISNEVPIFALTDGRIQASRWVSGYGGVTVLAFTWKNSSYLALYGHMDPASLLAVGTEVKKGQTIGRLGDNKSQETDGERRHLHFGIIKGNVINWRGYVSHENELDAWLDPRELYLPTSSSPTTKTSA